MFTLLESKESGVVVAHQSPKLRVEVRFLSFLGLKFSILIIGNKKMQKFAFFLFCHYNWEWKFYTFKHIVMPTTDSNAATQASGIPLPTTSQNDEFDLGITQTPVQEIEESHTVSVGGNSEADFQEASQTFDFNLDLPDTYSDIPNQQPNSVTQQSTEELLPTVSDVTSEEDHFLQEGSDKVLLWEEPTSGVAIDLKNPSFQGSDPNDTMNFFGEESQEEGVSADFQDNAPSSEVTQGMDWDMTSENQESLGFQDQDWISSDQTSLDTPEVDFLQSENAQVQDVIPQPLEVPHQEASTSVTKSEEPPKKVLNLDEMVSQFSTGGPQDFSQAEMDPFGAMKAILQVQDQEKQTDTQTSPIEKVSASIAPSVHTVQPTVSVPLDSVSVQESVLSQLQQASAVENNPLQSPSTPEVQNQMGVIVPPAQTLDLDALVAMPIPEVSTNPLTASATYPQQIVTQPAKNIKWVFVALVSVVMVVAVGAMLYMRYPDLFNLLDFNISGQGTGIIAQNPLEEEHGSAPETLFTWEVPSTGDEISEDNEIIPVEPQEISGDFLEEEWSGEIQTIDLTQGEESDLESVSWTTLNNENSDSGNTVSDGANDPLSSVEDLVGPINNNDVIKQEVLEYQRKGGELKEMGTVQNKRTMMKYGLAVEKEAQKILDDLVNGGNIDISTWSSLKVKFDGYLEKASNA